MQQQDLQDLELMKDQQIEYLDYRRPTSSKASTPPKRSPELEAMCSRLTALRTRKGEAESSNALKETQEASQPKAQSSFKLSITLELPAHRVVAKVGNYQDEEADAIVLPYASGQFEYYPCSSHREELKQDQEKIDGLQSQSGELYVRSKKFFKYKFRAFIRLQQPPLISDLLYGLNSLTILINENQKRLAIQTIAIPYSPDLFDLQQLLLSLSSSLEAPKQEKPLTFLVLLSSRDELQLAWKSLT